MLQECRVEASRTSTFQCRILSKFVEVCFPRLLFVEHSKLFYNTV